MYHDRRCCTTKLSSSSVRKHHGVANIAGDVAEDYLVCEAVGTAISGGCAVYARRPFFAAIIF